jgi:uncharacterized protein (DUF1697 family)
MVKTQYVALLRGINVGGNNIIKMADLKACFERIGFSDVVTYIQSGNVLFTDSHGVDTVTTLIEKELSKRFGYNACVVLVSQDELSRTVKKAPKGFGTKPDVYRYDVIFLKKPLKPLEVIETVPVNKDADCVVAGDHVLYFSRLISKASQSKLMKIVQSPAYKSLTIRNWNTTTKLLELMEK